MFCNLCLTNDFLYSFNDKSITTKEKKMKLKIGNKAGYNNLKYSKKMKLTINIFLNINCLIHNNLCSFFKKITKLLKSQIQVFMFNYSIITTHKMIVLGLYL